MLSFSTINVRPDELTSSTYTYHPFLLGTDCWLVWLDLYCQCIIVFVAISCCITLSKGRLQERRSNLHSLDCYSTEWRFEWLISPRNI